MATGFSVGDITVQGEVVSVQPGVTGYIGVRNEVSGVVFQYYADELEDTGERIDPVKLGLVLALSDAVNAAEQSYLKLKRLRDETSKTSRVPNVGEPEKELRFGPGDRVIVTSSTSRWDRMHGTVVEIIERRMDGFDYRVKSDSSGNLWPFSDAELSPMY